MDFEPVKSFTPPFAIIGMWEMEEGALEREFIRILRRAFLSQGFVIVLNYQIGESAYRDEVEIPRELSQHAERISTLVRARSMG